MPQYQTQLQAFKSQQIDMMEAIQEKDVQTVRGWKHAEVYEKGYRFMDYICWNMELPMFQDKRVRRALTMGIDIERIMKVLLTIGGEQIGKLAYSTLTPELKDYVLEEIKLLPYDVEAAKKLLAEAGWTDSNGDGIVDKDGKPFAFKLSTNTGNPRRADSVVFVKDDLKKIGVDVTIEKIEPNTFFDNLRHRDYEAALAGWSAGLFADPSGIWGSPTEDDPKPFNHCAYSNKRVDELIEKGLNTADLEEEKACWKELQQIIYDDQPYTFLFWRKEFFAVHKRVRDIEPNILSTLFGIRKWWVPKQERLFDF
jgi:peptide/nickel transport system substrate-binding protein